MKTQTLIALVAVVAVLAAGAVVLLGESGGSVTDWFRSLHGGGH
jgi:hypothetical protein